MPPCIRPALTIDWPPTSEMRKNHSDTFPIRLTGLFLGPWVNGSRLEFIARALKNNTAASACLATNQHSLPMPRMPRVSDLSKVGFMGVSYLGCTMRTECSSDLGRTRRWSSSNVIAFEWPKRSSPSHDLVGCSTATRSWLNDVGFRLGSFVITMGVDPHQDLRTSARPCECEMYG